MKPIFGSFGISRNRNSMWWFLITVQAIALHVSVPGYHVTPCDIEHRRLIVVRHGVVAPNDQRDGALSTAGAAEATAVAALIASAHGHEVRHLCASPPVHSAQLIARAISPMVELPLFAAPLHGEMYCGAWDGLAVGEIEPLWRAKVVERSAREDDYGRDVVGGEDVATLRGRSLAMRDCVLQVRTMSCVCVMCVCVRAWVCVCVRARAWCVCVRACVYVSVPQYTHTTQAEHVCVCSFSGDAAGDSLRGVHTRLGRASYPRRGAGPAGGSREPCRGADRLPPTLHP